MKTAFPSVIGYDFWHLSSTFYDLRFENSIHDVRAFLCLNMIGKIEERELLCYSIKKFGRPDFCYNMFLEDSTYGVTIGTFFHVIVCGYMTSLCAAGKEQRKAALVRNSVLEI